MSVSERLKLELNLTTQAPLDHNSVLIGDAVEQMQSTSGTGRLVALLLSISSLLVTT